VRIVTTIDNLPRKTAPVRVIAHANSARYRPYVRLALSIDSRKMIDLYMRFYPLFQMAHIELGYPRGYLNDRLIEAIDDLLAAPVIGEPIRLTQPRVLYQFMEEDLEA